MLDQLREHGSEILSRADAGPVARTRCGQSSFTIVSPGKTACKSRFWPFSIQIVLASTMHYHADLEWVRTAFRNFSRTVVILDNHSAHTSRETQRYLATRPKRFQFVFVPKHGSWLNLVEVLFSKMTRSMLREIRVNSKQELIDRIHLYFQQINADPVVFRWKYKMDEVSIA